MARIAVIVADQFEDSEFTRPVEAFREMGYEVVVVGIKAGRILRGKKGKAVARIEEAVGEISVEDFDALLIPGGHSPERLRKDKGAVNFAGTFLEEGKPVFAICHGPLLLAAAGALEGRRITAYGSIAGEIERAGAQYNDAEVVEDGNLVTSRTPRDLPAFIRSCLAKL